MPMTMRRLEVDGYCMKGVIGAAIITAVILHAVMIETEMTNICVAEAEF